MLCFGAAKVVAKQFEVIFGFAVVRLWRDERILQLSRLEFGLSAYFFGALRAVHSREDAQGQDAKVDPTLAVTSGHSPKMID